MRARWISVLIVALAASTVGAQRGPATARRGGAAATTVDCAAVLGTGVKSRRDFCDVIIGTMPSESVSINLPARSGAALLQFDLHNRFTIPAVAGPTVLAFARHEAVVKVIRASGESIGDAVVVREFRTVADSFDQIAGGGRPGGVKAVAPGRAEPVRFTIPAGVSTIGIVGVRLEVTTHAGGTEIFDAPGRPVAIVSNVRVTPAR